MRKKILCERKIIIKEKNSEVVKEVTITIGLPYDTGHESAACSVSIKGLLENLQDIEGMDSFQAIQLSIEFVERILKSMPAGKEVLWPDGQPYF